MLAGLRGAKLSTRKRIKFCYFPGEKTEDLQHHLIPYLKKEPDNIIIHISTAQLHSTKPELRFYTDLNSARGVSEIHDGEDLWQWSRLEIRLNVFRRSTIPSNNSSIIIIIIIIIIITNDSLYETENLVNVEETIIKFHPNCKNIVISSPTVQTDKKEANIIQWNLPLFSGDHRDLKKCPL